MHNISKILVLLIIILKNQRYFTIPIRSNKVGLKKEKTWSNH